MFQTHRLHRWWQAGACLLLALIIPVLGNRSAVAYLNSLCNDHDDLSAGPVSQLEPRDRKPQRHNARMHRRSPRLIAGGRVPPAIHCRDYWSILRRMERHSASALNRRLPQSTDLHLLAVRRPREVEILIARVVAEAAEHPEVAKSPYSAGNSRIDSQTTSARTAKGAPA